MTPKNSKYSASHLRGLLKFIYDFPMVKQKNTGKYCMGNAKVLLMPGLILFYSPVQPIAVSEHQPGIDGEQRIETVGRSGEIIVHRELRLYKKFTNGIFSAQEKSEGKRLEPQLVIEVNILGIVQDIRSRPQQCSISIG